MSVPTPVRCAREEVLLGRVLYDVVFYIPRDLIASGLGRFVEQPVIAWPDGEVTRGFRVGSGELGRVQNGLVRTYALALAGGIAVLAVVFLSTR